MSSLGTSELSEVFLSMMYPKIRVSAITNLRVLRRPGFPWVEDAEGFLCSSMADTYLFICSAPRSLTISPFAVITYRLFLLHEGLWFFPRKISTVFRVES